MNTSGSTKKRAHHFKTDAEWLKDVEQTAKAVRRQNECGSNSAVELAPSEVLELVRLARLALEPAADVAALNRELCDKEGHVLGVIARPCLRCHAWFDPQYGKNMNLADSRDLSLFALMVLTNLTGATPATHPDTFKVAQQYADAWRSRQPETKEVKP